jgi:hypothetical protein
MTKIKQLLAALAVSVASAGSADASLVAGWDFSQYLDNTYTLDGATAAPDTLSANYSGLDPTFGAGAESAAFGRMRLPFTPVGDGSEPFLPSAGSLTPNLGLPTPNPFDSLTILASEGQALQSLLNMLAVQSVSVVFEADLSSIPQAGSDWQISLASVLDTSVTSGSITFSFSSDGVNYSPLGSLAVTGTAGVLTTNAIAATSDRAFFKLDLTPGVRIDNVGILATVPEPLTASMLIAGLGGLALMGRRRS